jgi:hypothetical protein
MCAGHSGAAGAEELQLRVQHAAVCAPGAAQPVNY